MERQAMAALAAWNDRSDRLPLVLRGARQVGKTWLLREFGRRSFERTVYLNCEQNPLARSVFEPDLDTRRIVETLALVDGGGPIDPARTLIVLDEIQEAPRALAALKYFAEDAPGYRVVCAGSLLGVALHPGTSFPVGKVDFLDLRPLSFTEFLDAADRASQAQALRERRFDLLAPFHATLVDLLRRYYYVGGMPGAVAAYFDRDDLAAARTVHGRILDAYQQDFSKHAPTAQVPRIHDVFTSLPAQLARENRKFVYGQARPGARAKDLELALQWLTDTGIVTRVTRVTVPRLPLAAYADSRAFKLYLVDVGLLGAASGLGARTIIEGNTLFTEFRGALAEQHVLQALLANNPGPEPRYWTSGSSAEVDFVVQTERTVVPVEVKAERNLRAKSLATYRAKFDPPLAVRCSLLPYEEQPGLVNLPLYAAETLPEVVEALMPRDQT